MARAVHNGILLVPFGAAGAPSSGTWEKGTIIVDSTGAAYLCTASGTPGTWSQLSTSGAASVGLGKIIAIHNNLALP
jgi:hypothetical protein